MRCFYQVSNPCCAHPLFHCLFALGLAQFASTPQGRSDNEIEMFNKECAFDGSQYWTHALYMPPIQQDRRVIHQL
uniref:Secreted protein n=1 Tax=Kalanchoe fedtschenkoi TaxID=63787 RepID=A0A7N0VJD3_KALFE